MNLVNLNRCAKWSKLTSTCSLLVLFAQIATAETILIDDFNDGNDNGWTPFDSEFAQPWGPGIIEVNGKDEYWLASRRSIPRGSFGNVGAVWDEGANDPLYSNGTYRARVRVEGENTRAGISMRGSGSIATGFNAYNFEIQPTRLFSTIRIGRMENTIVVDTESVNLPLPLHEDLFLEAAADGDQLSFKVWPAAEPEPEAPQVTWTDSTYQAGSVAIYAYREIGQGGGFVFGGDVSATFDDLTFVTPTVPAETVPEPASILLLSVGALVFLARSRLRRSARAVFVLALACLLTAVVADQSAAQTTFSFGTFDVTSADTPADTRTLTIPQGRYNAFSITVDWAQVQGDPWSEEAIWAIADGPFGAEVTTLYADPGSAPSSEQNGDSISLEWNGMLDLPINGPTDVSLWLQQAYQFGRDPFIAEWGNTVVELAFVTPPPSPTLTAHLGVVATPFSALTIDTNGSNFDTELGLFSETGQLFLENDDFGGEMQSLIDVSNGLPAGDYVAAVGGFNTVFSDAYANTPGDVGGDYGVNVAGSLFEGALAAGEMAYVGFSIGEAGIPGDFNGDRVVDGTDFLAWQRGESPDPLSSSDLKDWEANFGTVISGQLVGNAPVPEPGTLVLLLTGMAAVRICTRRATGIEPDTQPAVSRLSARTTVASLGTTNLRV